MRDPQREFIWRRANAAWYVANCPTCNVRVGQACRDSAGEKIRTPYVHAERLAQIKAAVDALQSHDEQPAGPGSPPEPRSVGG